MRTYGRLLRLLPAVLLALLATSPRVTSALEPERIARAVSVQGTVEARRAGASGFAPVKLDEAFSAGDTIRVGARSRAVLALLDRTVLQLAAGTTVTLEPPGPERAGVLDLVQGLLHVLTRGPRSLDVRTELVNVGVRGTEFVVAAEQDATSVTVFEGAVVAENAQGSVSLGAGQSAVAARGKPPELRLVARPRDAVRWALHYPAVVDVRPAELTGEAGAQERLRVSVAAWREGNVGAALAALPEAAPADPRVLAYRAQLLLAVGRVDEAGADLDRALAASPRDPAALSLQAIVAVVQNDRDRALTLARAAVEAAPASATAQLALSYALQARFDLPGARASADRAVALDPRDALAWARLAELRASFGDTGGALDAANRAAALAPDLSRTHTVLGFARLAAVKPAAAEREFERAIALDSADPLPRLGLGLARVRKGELERGARDVEIAAALAPDDALVRSYLGKAYFEEKREALAERELATAKGLDPLDPTPWFYDALAKQAANRPVEALWDLDRANALNGGRAVYRSRLLLDSDLAARSASLGRVYGDLGFQQLAVAEGVRSVELDPASESAHRLLADSYAALPRHEVSRVSELLQAQLLQPLNVTPIQPRLGESNLLLAGRGGPGLASFGELNPAFERDRAVAQVSGYGGDGSTGALEPLVGAVYRNVAVSAGLSRFRTNGFRTNGGQDDELVDAFAQAELTRDTSVQAELRHRSLDFGYLQPYFFPDAAHPNASQSNTYDTYRVGARHAFSPGSIVLASAMYQKSSIDELDRNVDPVLVGFDLRHAQEAGGGELQHLLRTRWLDVVSGAGFFRITGTDHTALTLALPPPPFGPGTIVSAQEVDRATRHANAYAYAHLHLAPSLTATVGASGDRVRSVADGDRDQLNPKLGVTWSPLAGTTLRAAAFRVLKRTLIADQTLEPTQVAGFSQFFDDVNGTRAWRYGVGADHRFSPAVFGGVEGSRRDLDVPLTIVGPDGAALRTTTWREYEARSYLFWTPRAWLALRAEYAFERLVRDPERATFGVVHANTHRVPLGVAVFHPSGLGATATVTYLNQRGSFGESVPFTDGSDRFWLVDAGISWRLPRRTGTVAVVATNLFDRRFNLYENGTNNWNPTVQPARAVFARVTLAGP